MSGALPHNATPQEPSIHEIDFLLSMLLGSPNHDLLPEQWQVRARAAQSTQLAAGGSGASTCQPAHALLQHPCRACCAALQMAQARTWLACG